MASKLGRSKVVKQPTSDLLVTQTNMSKSSLYELGYSKLNDFQKKILEECYKKKNGGMSLPMGSGKTLLSIVLGLKLTQNTNNPVLVVVSKTLMSNWVEEINKFFGDSLKYCILHQDHQKNIQAWTIPTDVHIVLTTSNVISKFYTDANIERHFVFEDTVNHGAFLQHTLIRYNVPNTPYANVSHGASSIYSCKWGCVLVDEIQKFTNVTTKQCRGIASLCAQYRWGLSGTMFDEPKIERILGYYLIINHPTFPRNLPEAEFLVRSYAFKGVNETIVKRTQNDAFIPPKLKETIIKHMLEKEEEKVYLCMKETLKDLNKEVERYKRMRDTQNVRKFNSYLLAMITYLRQSVICPLLPIANVALDVSNYEDKSLLSEMLLTVIRKLDIDDWLNKKESVLSSRLQNVLNVINKHSNERLVVFTSFRTCLDILKAYLPTDRPNFILTANMSTTSRGKTLEQFEKSDKGILVMTYDLGAEGLNIQSAHTVLLIDLWWNSAKTKQAISRVFRFGQTSPVVNVYYFTSNTGIEKALLDKHTDKLDALDEIQTGCMKTNVKTIQMKEILKILETEENVGKLTQLNKRIH